MKSTRRSMLRASALAAGSVLAGCTADGDAPEGQTAQRPPVPRIADHRYPRPQVQNVEDELVSESRHQFSAEIRNAGAGGDVGIALVWLAEEGADVYGPASEVADERETAFEPQEPQEVTFTAEFPEEYEAFGFRAWATTIEADVRNAGGSGSVLVQLLDGEEVLEETELEMAPGEVTTVEFDGDYADRDFEDVTIETSVA